MDRRLQYIIEVSLNRFSDVDTVVKWNNKMQSYVEALPHGIPIALGTVMTLALV